MFLKNRDSGDLVHVEELLELVDPHESSVTVRYQAGEEMGDPVREEKAKLVFPSGEELPRCWIDPHYRVSFD
ncbi:MAG: acetyltransferase [Zetaproteobacteria bacterium]|nr:MAG: acetyltransferase [Zetaproteobacteria bacterium]